MTIMEILGINVALNELFPDNKYQLKGTWLEQAAHIFLNRHIWINGVRKLTVPTQRTKDPEVIRKCKVCDTRETLRYGFWKSDHLYYIYSKHIEIWEDNQQE